MPSRYIGFFWNGLRRAYRLDEWRGLGFRDFLSWTKQGLSGKEDSKELTHGLLWKSVVLLSIPMMAEMLMESVFAVVDMYFVSKLGVQEPAIVGITESVLMLMYSLAVGLSVGLTAMISRRVGEGRFRQAGLTAVQGLALSLGLSLVLALPGIWFAGDVLRLMGANAGLIEKGERFAAIMYGGNLSILWLFALNAIFRGAGNASLAMRTLILANGLNLVLDPLFIFGLGSWEGMGLEGAAVATNIGRFVGVAYQLYYFLGGKSRVRVFKHQLRLNAFLLKRLVTLSSGGVVQFLIESASWMFLIRVMTGFGDAALAAYTIAFRIIVFTILPGWGLANAAATLAGQNIGAGFPQRAREAVMLCLRLNVAFYGLLSLFLCWASPWLAQQFNPDPEVVKTATLGLRVISLGYIFFSAGMVFGQSLNGAGDTKSPMFINLIAFWGIQIPLAYVLANTLELGPLGVFASIAFCHSLYAVMAGWVFGKGRWAKVLV
jgi:putative MATE family efflux protein